MLKETQFIGVWPLPLIIVYKQRVGLVVVGSLVTAIC